MADSRVIRGLSKFLKVFKSLCDVLDWAYPAIYNRLPPSQQSALANLKTAVDAFCLVVDVLDPIGDTIPPNT